MNLVNKNIKMLINCSRILIEHGEKYKRSQKKPQRKKNSLSEMKMLLTRIKSKFDTEENCPK